MLEKQIKTIMNINKISKNNKKRKKYCIKKMKQVTNISINKIQYYIN